MRQLLVYTTDAVQLQSFLPDDIEITFHSSVRPLQKTIRSVTPGELLLHLDSHDQYENIIKIADYIRKGLNNEHLWLRVLINEDMFSEQISLNKLGVFNDLVILNKASSSVIKQANALLIRHIDITKQALEEKAAQTEMLSSINRFSQHRHPMQQLIQSCAEALTRFCSGYTTVIVTPKKISAVKTVGWELPNSLINELTEQESQEFITSALSCKAPKIELLPKNLANQSLIKSMEKEVGSYITFPIIVYKDTVAAIVCFIAEEDLDKISTSQLNVMRDTSGQLQVILERRFAESKLASQYQRLKSTISELKSTQDQLVHSEKMASVGQMAAGLAHEINNPLAFVIGNFDPLEDYVSTILQMLNLHDKLVASLDQSSDSAEVRKKVDSLREENDLDFVIEDVKAVVNDSREGLLRVRDIISDLSSFTRKERLESSTVEIPSLVKETLRLLKYEMNHDVTLSSSCNVESRLVSHRGFIQQILTNLIKNSNHALADLTDKTDKAICLDASEDQGMIIFSVTDNGPGISNEAQKQIFDPFFTTKEVGKGTGLGLSVSYNLAKKMGGDLSVNSDGKSHTEFQLRLPVSS